MFSGFPAGFLQPYMSLVVPSTSSFSTQLLSVIWDLFSFDDTTHLFVKHSFRLGNIQHQLKSVIFVILFFNTAHTVYNYGVRKTRDANAVTFFGRSAMAKSTCHTKTPIRIMRFFKHLLFTRLRVSPDNGVIIGRLAKHVVIFLIMWLFVVCFNWKVIIIHRGTVCRDVRSD